VAAPDIILLEGLSKTFSGGWPWKKMKALLGVDLAVREGEIIGYLGPNGAGKTTTLKLLVGLLRPTAGRVLVAGRPPSEPEARSRIGFLPENPYFYEYLTGREFLSFCGRLGGLSGAGLKRRVQPLLEQVGLGHAADRPLRKYSKGMLQRIGLAQALVNDPPILILDEPMTGLDPIGRREVRDLILDLKKSGKTVLFSSHILADVELICDRVAFLHRGRLLEVRSLEQLLGSEAGMVEVKVRGLEPDALEGAGGLATDVIRGQEGLVLVLDSPARLPAVLELLRQRGATLVSVSPRRESLEDLFLKLVAEHPA
jgi:ABC-2 type transport system ATP-binding protein